ncbi:hypothetical protein ACHAQA_006708 [Verticillium albo-atrum]
MAQRPINILVINPNSSQPMTQGMETAIKGMTSSDVIYTYTAPPESPPSIDNDEHIQSSTEIVLKDLANSGELEKYDGVLVACYSVHTLVDRLSRQYGDRLAVTGIFEASILTATAMLPQTILGTPPSRWGIVTTGQFWEKHLGDGVVGYLGQPTGAGGAENTKFKGVVSSGLTAGDFHHVSPEEVKAKLEEATRKLLGDGGVSCVAMGCGGMAGLEDIIRSTAVAQYGPEKGGSIYVVDGVKAGIIQLEQTIRFLRVSYNDDEKFERALASIRRLALVAVDYDESRPQPGEFPPVAKRQKLAAMNREEMDERSALTDKTDEMNWLQLVNDVQARQPDPTDVLTTDEIVSKEFKYRFHTTVVQDKDQLDGAGPEQAEEHFQAQGWEKRESGARSRFFMYLDDETINHLAGAPNDEALATMTIDERCRVAWDHWVKIVKPPYPDFEDDDSLSDEEEAWTEDEIAQRLVAQEVEAAQELATRRRRIRLLCLLSLYLNVQDDSLDEIANEGADPNRYANHQDDTEAWCFAMSIGQGTPFTIYSWLEELYGRKEREYIIHPPYRPDTPAFIEDLRIWREKRADARAKLELAKPPPPASSFAVFRHRPRTQWVTQGLLEEGPSKPGRKIWRYLAALNDRSIYCTTCKPQNCWGSTIIRVAYREGDDARVGRAVAAVRRLSLVAVDYDEEASHQEGVDDRSMATTQQKPTTEEAAVYMIRETHWRDAARKVRLRGPPRFLKTDQIVSEEFKYRFHNTLIEDQGALGGEDVERARLFYRESGSEARDGYPHLRSNFFIYFDEETLDHLKDVPTDEELDQMTLEERCRVAFDHWVKVVAPLPEGDGKVEDDVQRAAGRRRIRLINILPVYMKLLDVAGLREVDLEAAGQEDGSQDRTKQWCFVGDSEGVSYFPGASDGSKTI